jgi:hypothetical protein
LPPTHANESQHWLLLVQLKSVPRHLTRQRAPSQPVPEQQKGAAPFAPHAWRGPAQPDSQVPCPAASMEQPRPSQQSPLESHEPPLAMQRGGPQIPPTQAPLQHAAPLVVHEVPSDRQPNEHRLF